MLNNKTLRFILRKYGVTHAQAARELGISERQIRRYVAGTTKMPRVVQLAICWQLRYWRAQ